MSFGFFRTVWITLRASNYTTRAFEDTIRGMNKLQQEQLKFKMNAAKNILAVGTMYLAFGGIAIGMLGQVMNASKHGQQVMENFSERIGKSMSQLGDALARILAPILNVVASLLEIAFAIPLVKELVAVALILGTAFLLIKGITMVLGSVITMLGIQHGVTAGATVAHSQTILSQYIPATQVATTATLGLAQAIGFVVSGFMIGFAIVTAIGQLFGKTIGIIVGITIALIGLAVALVALRAAGGDITGLVTFGGALAAGGAMGAAFLASQPEYGMGTSFVRKGGLARVHGGEEIKSARESKVQPRWQTTQEYKRTNWNVNISMGDVHTKADEEKMIPMLKRALKEALDNKN